MTLEIGCNLRGLWISVYRIILKVVWFGLVSFSFLCILEGGGDLEFITVIVES